MGDAVVEVSLQTFPPNSIVGIYLKGSSVKPWDSPIDYVPELSDMDVHISLEDDQLIDRYINDIDKALSYQRHIESIYLSRRGNPLHIPRLQILFLNELEKQDGYLPSPQETVQVLYGQPYPETDYSDTEKIKNWIAQNAEEHRDFLTKYPMQIFDKHHRYNFQSLRFITWRIGPSGPQTLILKGIPVRKSWNLNRTNIVTLPALKYGASRFTGGT
ncbi:MAG: hypothetical protein ACE5JU_21700, partial [Candidatus Binatia bacterium]